MRKNKKAKYYKREKIRGRERQKFRGEYRKKIIIEDIEKLEWLVAKDKRSRLNNSIKIFLSSVHK